MININNIIVGNANWRWKENNRRDLVGTYGILRGVDNVHLNAISPVRANQNVP